MRLLLPSLQFDSLIANAPTSDAVRTAIVLSNTESLSFAQSLIANTVATAITVVSSGVVAISTATICVNTVLEVRL